MEEDRSATFVSFIGRPVCFAGLVHVSVGLNSVEVGERHAVLAKQLAVLGAWIGCLTSLRELVVCIKEVELVDILWNKLSGVNIKIIK